MENEKKQIKNLKLLLKEFLMYCKYNIILMRKKTLSEKIQKHNKYAVKDIVN
jgi:hypothetical protein